jgi:DNA-binding winged helix-turn-helix (wHTH) protein
MGLNAPLLLENIFRFDRFEADRERYQLRREGLTIKLECIPLELLFLLLEHRGKLVNREQIAARLWRDDSFLDTERSINTAVCKIRRALGDDPRCPRFLETVVGRGYRFITPPVTEPEFGLPEIESGLRSAAHGGHRHSSEIRLRGFVVETTAGIPILTCDVFVSNVALGRFPLMELELPPEVSFPLRKEHRLRLKLHGVRASLTAKAVQALHAFCISVLESGSRTRATDSPRISQESLAKASPADAEPDVGSSSSG